MLRSRVAARLEDLAGAPSGGGVRTVSPELLHLIAVPVRPPAGSGTPFSWRPARVRRSLGLLAVARHLQGSAGSLPEAVEHAADLAEAAWRRSGRDQHHWEPWLAACDPATRAEVLAQATTWAAGLVTSIDWPALHSGYELGPHDSLWAVPPDRQVRLKSRTDVRIALPLGQRARRLLGRGTPDPQRHVALVVVLNGCPTPVAETAIAYAALVEGLRHPARPLPVRVGGIWPDAGEVRVVDIDDSTLTQAIDLGMAFLSTGPAEAVRPCDPADRAATPS
ncbi:MAG: hypothetical protein ACYCX8_12045 [Acidimicrobiales bacterium]